MEDKINTTYTSPLVRRVSDSKVISDNAVMPAAFVAREMVMIVSKHEFQLVREEGDNYVFLKKNT